MILELYKDLKANVSNLLKNIDKIDELVKERSAEIKKWDSNTVYSQNTINEKKRSLWESYAQRIKPFADNAIKSLVEIRDSTEVYQEGLNFRDPALKDALFIIDTAKETLPVQAQSSIAHSFRGNVPALQLLKGIYHKYGYWVEGTIHELLKPIPYFVYDEVFSALSMAAYDGTWEKPHNLKEFSDFAVRMDFDISSNPYINELERFIMEHKGNDRALEIYKQFREKIDKAAHVMDIEKVKALCTEAITLILATVQADAAI